MGGGPNALPGLGLAAFVTCRDALSHLSVDDVGRPVRLRMRPVEGKNGGDESRVSVVSAPAKTVMAKASRKGGQILSAPHPRHPISEHEAPSRCIKTNGGRAAGGGSTLAVSPRHLPATADEPAGTIRAGGNGHSAPQVVLALNDRHPPSQLDAPAHTIAARDRCQGATTLAVREPDPNRPPTPADAVARTLTQARDQALLAWPWDRPATTIARDERIPPPGHHSANAYMSSPNAIVLSEKAAAILQGFPEGWVFAGKTKRSRWSQLGQAMPPGLAEPVARAIVEQMKSARLVSPAPRHRRPSAAVQPPAVVDDARSASALPEG